MALEALNHAGQLAEDLLVVLNDNKMSIAKTVGALSEYLNRIRTSPRYQELRDEAERLLDRVPVVGHRMKEAADHLRQVLRHAWPGGRLFEDLGFHYYGPVDGHDIPALVAVLERMRLLKGPVLLHVLTQKGMGLDPAKVGDISFAHAANPAPPHPAPPKGSDKGACAIDARKEAQGAASARPAYAKVFGKALVAAAETRTDVVAITAAMPDNTGLDAFQKACPDRFIDVGICEQHAVGLAGGLAHAGRRPVAVIFSSFLQRAYDQLFHEVSLQKAHVVFGIDRAGLVGSDGPTHHGTNDIVYLRPLPHVVLMAPKDEGEVARMLAFALDAWAGPSAIRYPRAGAPDLSRFGCRPVELGRSERLLEGDDGVILAYGAQVDEALKAAAIAKDHGVALEVVNARFAKPIDVEMVRQALRRHPFVMTVEDGMLLGGFGSAVLEVATEAGGPLAKIIRLGLPDRFIEHASREVQMADAGIDAASILRAVAQRLDRRDLLAVAVDHALTAVS
jgi:1-deoxy-D-xylulose-5-phosphate synthase